MKMFSYKINDNCSGLQEFRYLERMIYKSCLDAGRVKSGYGKERGKTLPPVKTRLSVHKCQLVEFGARAVLILVLITLNIFEIDV